MDVDCEKRSFVTLTGWNLMLVRRSLTYFDKMLYCGLLLWMDSVQWHQWNVFGKNYKLFLFDNTCRLWSRLNVFWVIGENFPTVLKCFWWLIPVLSFPPKTEGWTTKTENKYLFLGGTWKIIFRIKILGFLWINWVKTRNNFC